MFQGSLAGFVLVGGKSLRMGRDKALLPFAGRVLAQQVAREVARVASPVCLVGPSESYSNLGMPVIPDAVGNRGPLSGIEAALLSEHARDWNLITACDMPRIDAQLFFSLITAIEPSIDCVVPRSVSGKLEPLCALYTKGCGPQVSAALADGTRRVVDMVAMLQAKFWPINDLGLFQNVNTVPDWDKFLNDR